MPLRLVLISPQGSLVRDGKLHPDLIQAFCGVIQRLYAHGVRSVIWSNRRWTVNSQVPLSQFLTERAGCPVDLVGAQVDGYPARRRGGSVDPILARYGVARAETILVGNSEEDLMAGVNNQLLLVRPEWYENDSEYGFSVASVADLERFCTIFGLRKHPIYWALNHGSLSAYAMGPYSTKIMAYAGFGVDAFHAAKHETGSLGFWHRLIVSSLYFSGLIAGVDYIATYPGHTSTSKVKAVDEVMSSLGKCFRKTFYPDLIVRHTSAQKSAFMSAGEKTYRNQLNTIQLNARPNAYGVTPRKSSISLTNKTVLVVDDILTQGRSLESARSYIEAAGGRARLFAWLKTINTSYLQMNRGPSIKPFQVNVVKVEPDYESHSYVDGIVDAEAPSEIATLLDQYKAWTV